MKFDITRYSDCVINLRTREDAEIFAKYLATVKKKVRGHSPSELPKLWERYRRAFCFNIGAGSYGSYSYYWSRAYRILQFDSFDWGEYEVAEENEALDNFLLSFIPIAKEGVPCEI